ncbi:hypothetical protein KC19_VG295600 [Ceratodon purpureus]|uniref:Uncharacterized protein n=1 Tax=Ceratodon purpureus TaxID=3225 RepID=A0A8T0HWQ6_CERPU|nr:hypothetical protein KC19_VG295600 [Ceratodon purpureus]
MPCLHPFPLALGFRAHCPLGLFVDVGLSTIAFVGSRCMSTPQVLVGALHG